ncbi:MAG TPA: sigma 54-interacting transcriptional regulator, partial [Acidobacteriota bacterium]|nr:sigma 54-interacting transcriptional regulator [Acidobacteriota bacterium]
MNPRLIAVAGPCRGDAFPISTESQSIGRDSSNWISVTGRSVSRKHCAIAKAGSDFTVIDLDSKNGTSVNGIPIRERILKEGDRIEVGESVFLFVTSDQEEDAASAVGDEGLSAIPTARLRMEDVIYLEPERLLTSVPLTARIARGLDALLKLSRSIQAVHDSDMLEQQILQCVFDITPAERASLIRIHDESKDIEFIRTCDRKMQPLASAVSTSVIQLVIREGAALLSNDVLQDSSGIHSNSLARLNVTSLIAVPMTWRGLVRGILYLDTGDSGVRFDEDHLQLASAIAAIGAVSLEGLRHLTALQDDHSRLIEDLRITHSMVGESPAMKGVYDLIGKVAPVDATVLIVGESGTGKELAARAIHLNSPRCGKPLVAINCANLSENLLESELFGYEKGAFTGAHALKKGRIEAEEGGTLFLDEISELALPLQARLLRVLQEREFERVGGTRPVQVDVRLIAATNKDLHQAVKDGKFRDDLFYRLNVVQIKLPPLRERKDDIPLLASYFAAMYARKCGRKVEGISPEARRLLMEYNWPGNIRELQNTMERAVVLGNEDLILPEDL